MKQQRILSSLRALTGLATFVLLLAGCDTFESDVTQPEVKISDEELYVLAEGETVIDLKALLSANFAGRLSVTEQPRQGTLQPITDGLMRYAPKKGVSRTRDSFEFTVYAGNNSIVTKDTVYINVETDSTKLPCSIYPVADYVTGFDGTSVSVNVLSNDLLCDKSVTLQIYQPVPNFLPHHGTAAVNGTTVVYTPGTTFTGRDTLIYKVANAQNPASFGYGFVYINRDSVCGFTLADDTYQLDSVRSTETYYLDVFSNDQLCDSLDTYNISVVTSPKYGTVVRSGRGFNFRKTSSQAVGSDEFIYAVKQANTQKTARVKLTWQSGTNPCFFQAQQDSVDIAALSTSLVYIDVLKNDQLCDSLKTFTITRHPLNGTAFIDSSTKRVGYNRVVMKSDSLQYEICNGKVCSRATVFIKQN